MKLDIYLIIGLTKESRHWNPLFINALKEKLNPNSIQVVDLPGSGTQINEKSPLSMKEIVAKARSQFVFHPAHQRVVIAISLGGMTAWSWVTEFPEDFTHMVMINSSLGNLSPVWKRVQPTASLNFFKVAMAPKGKVKERLIIDLCANNAEKAKKIYPQWVKIGEESTMSLPNTLRQLFAATTFKPKKIPKIPMLVLAARHDRLAHFSCSQSIVNHASKETKVKFMLHEDPNVGHAFHVDDPDFIAEQTSAWLQEIGAIHPVTPG